MPRWGEVVWINGQAVFIDGHGKRQRVPPLCRHCGNTTSSLLCDFPLPAGRVCSAPLCQGCAVHRAGADFCPTHDWRMP
jgi:hypothetical protein